MQVGDQFPIEEIGRSKREGPAVVYFYPPAGSDAGGKLMDDIRSQVQEVAERWTTPT